MLSEAGLTFRFISLSSTIRTFTFRRGTFGCSGGEIGSSACVTNGADCCRGMVSNPVGKLAVYCWGIDGGSSSVLAELSIWGCSS
jgi:hypothetical protein